ncbi:phosphomethylpyrimidine synthase ThiC [Candidatus Omnitrophota bacterium]
MTQLEAARKKIITAQIRKIARLEEQALIPFCAKIAQGEVVIPFSKIHRPSRPCGIGAGLTTKVNANIGTSSERSKIDHELKKMRVSVASGADTVMDLSTGGDLARIRRSILESSPVPVGTVPIYQAAVKAVERCGEIGQMTEADILTAVEDHARDGVDFFTLHCGVTIEAIARLKQQKRITDIVSRGGAILIEWMTKNKKENPLYKYFDRVLDIAKRFDVTISLGDGMRPGCLADATDRTQVQELILLGELAKQAKLKGVQVIIEGPGHVPLNQIETNVVLQKKVCQNAPFYVLGPLVTDIAPGYDHITSAIGGALAASYGADFLCYVTASEHLRLPTIKDVKEGVITARIAAHAADIAKGIKRAQRWDVQMSQARKRRDWKKQIELAVDPEQAQEMRRNSKSRASDVCTMCSQYCSMKIMETAQKRLKK